MLTPLGRLLRKVRIDHGELMKHMSDKLGVTASYLSAVEMGKKAMPSGWVNTLCSEYSEFSPSELSRLAEISKPEFRVSIPVGTEDLRREAVAAFAKQVGTMDTETLNQLLSVMLEKGECE